MKITEQQHKINQIISSNQNTIKQIKREELEKKLVKAEEELDKIKNRKVRSVSGEWKKKIDTYHQINRINQIMGNLYQYNPYKTLTYLPNPYPKK